MACRGGYHPPAWWRPGLRRPHFLSERKWGERKGGGGISSSLPHAPTLDRPRRGNCDSPFLELPPSCPTGNIPAEGAYAVTPPRLGTGDRRSPLRIITIAARVFQRQGTDGGPAGQLGTTQRLSGLAGQSRCVPPKARRRRPKLRIVRFRAGPKAHSLRWASSPHRTRFAGLRRGPQLPQAPANRAGGNARPVFALSVQPTAANSPRTGGGAGGTPPAPSFPPFLWEEMGAPAGQARPARGAPR